MTIMYWFFGTQSNAWLHERRVRGGCYFLSKSVRYEGEEPLTLISQRGPLTPPPPSAILLIVRERIRMAPHRSLTFFFWVLHIFWNKFFEYRTYRYKVTWPFCFCMSARKSLILVICVQNMMEISFFHKRDLVYSLGVYFGVQNSWIIDRIKIKPKKTIKYIN